MAIVFNTPKSALNTTSGAIQIKNGDNLQEKSVTYNQEGEFTVVPDSGMYGLSKVDITIDVPSDVHNQTATVDPSTSQQVVEPEEGYTGLSSVTVNAVTSAIDQNIAAGNIKSGVTILGVSGVYDPQPILEEKRFEPELIGSYQISPSSGYDGLEFVDAFVDVDLPGGFWNPFELSDDQRIGQVYNKISDGKFPAMMVCFGMEVKSGSIDSRSGFYVAEDANGNSFAIKPYLDNPDFDPENPDPEVPKTIFPENFDLSGFSVQVYADIRDDVTITENKSEDPLLEPTYTVEISECELAGINRNSDMDSWPLYWNGGLSGNIEASTRNLGLSTNELSQMSISSPEAWEIEIDQPQAQSQMNVRPLAKSGLRSAAPTLNISQMSGDAGVFTLDVLSTEDQNTGFTVRGLNSGNELHIDVNSMGDYFTIESLEDNNTITWRTFDNQHILDYSTDEGETWNTMELEASGSWYVWSIDLNEGETVKFRGDNDELALDQNMHFSRFATSKTVNVFGHICSLLRSSDFVNYQFSTTNTFNRLFNGGQVVDASGLILPDNVTSYCYMLMFEYNSTLTNAPELPAKSMQPYCYSSMFVRCTSLTIPPELPATILAQNCYDGMFSNSGIIEAPELPAIHLADSCYAQMFARCTSLVSAPELPAINLASGCYSDMFNGCTSLTESPILPAESLQMTSYYRMFKGCTSLESVTCLATDISASSCTAEWLDGVAAEGTFSKDANMTGWTLDSADGIPTGWTVKDYTE